MTRRSMIWLAVAVPFTVLNFAGGVIAASRLELFHTAMHAGLMLVGAYFVLRIGAGRDTRGIGRREGSVIPAVPGELTDRLTHLEQAIDAVAIEIERIGEWQRFITHSFTGSAPPPAPGEGAAEPIEIETREAAPHGGPLGR